MPPRVSVCMIAYKHEPYVAQALDSVLMQETDFEVECIIGDDASPDGTADVIRSYVARYPGRIQAVLRETNIGARRNVMDVKRRARGQYVAQLEADDYWTDPHKLSKQVAFLEAHPDCTLCGHRIRMVDTEGQWDGVSMRPESEVPQITDLDYLIANGYYLQTCSIMYRREALGEYPEWYQTISAGDMALYVLLALRGHLGYLDECMADRRVHAGGMYSGMAPLARTLRSIRFREEIREHLPERFGPVLDAQVRDLYAALLMGAARDRTVRLPLRLAARCGWHTDARLLLGSGWTALRNLRRGMGFWCGLAAALKAPARLEAPRLMACALLNRIPAATRNP